MIIKWPSQFAKLVKANYFFMYHIASLNIGFDYFMVIIEKTLTKYFAIFTQQSK